LKKPSDSDCTVLNEKLCIVTISRVFASQRKETRELHATC
jgi:hypothetical protein